MAQGGPLQFLTQINTQNFRIFVHMFGCACLPFQSIKKPLHPLGCKGFPYWWRRVDSNHRSETQQIYSLPPLATRELLRMQLELVDGFEPPTC